MPEINLTSEDNHVKIYVDGLIHIAFARNKLVGFQSWIEGDKLYRYCIEFVFEDNDFLAEYDVREKWETVLKLLDKANLFEKAL